MGIGTEEIGIDRVKDSIVHPVIISGFHGYFQPVPAPVGLAVFFEHRIKDSADALHLACAESAGAALLTTDDTIIKIIKKHGNQITIEVKNPVEWLMEVNEHGSKDTQ
jgi:hypothetical protein